MADFKYLIVGGGMTADAAVRGIRELDRSGTIGLLGAEPDPPYDRPPLSKGLWKGKPVEKIWRRTSDQGVSLCLDRRAVSIERRNHEVIDGKGETYRYEKLLLATGGTPRRISSAAEGVIYFRSLQDYYALRQIVSPGRHLAVIGGGFIGSELAAAITLAGGKALMIFPEAHIGARVFPGDLGAHIDEYYQGKGVELRRETSLTRIEKKGDRFRVWAQPQAGGGKEEVHEVDGVVAGIGIQPNVELAKQAGLEAEDGIVVDPHLRTADPSIFAAGDVAAFWNPALSKRMRVEHEDNANTMGMAAGKAMAGQLEEYTHLPFFYSDLFDLGYEAVGELDPRLTVVADWKKPGQEGVLYYLKGGRVRGVLLWNVWNQVAAARQLIADPGPFGRENLIGRLPEAHK
ncbi:MAG: FAD/NAD(P)-binding oxidoreductase [Anaerolineales bacterium]|jgi:NADPH-dependent 2,4-dienoyl-CoA reductase/sulfur reductase-like enzyme